MLTILVVLALLVPIGCGEAPIEVPPAPPVDLGIPETRDLNLGGPSGAPVPVVPGESLIVTNNADSQVTATVTMRDINGAVVASPYQVTVPAHGNLIQSVPTDSPALHSFRVEGITGQFRVVRSYTLVGEAADVEGNVPGHPAINGQECAACHF